MTDEYTFNKTESRKGDEDRPEELDVIEMTEDLYRELFFGPNPTNQPWIIGFLKTRRSQDHLWMCQYAMNMMRMLADEYQGKVRFAYIISHKQEKLKEIFDVKTLPNIFLIENGTAYEQEMLRVMYGSFVRFIEPGDGRPGITYASFPVPRVYTELELKLKYVYNYVWDVWHRDRFSDTLVTELSQYKLSDAEGDTVWAFVEPYVRKHLLDLRLDHQVIRIC